MKLAIMQPYFFPYIGYFSLIYHTDKFILFDPVQYIKKGWMNRNRVLKPNEGWQYITAPVQGASRDTLIKDTLLVEGEEWKKQILRQLEHYKKRAPYYAVVKDLLENCFSNKALSITQFNAFCLENVCGYLSVPFNYEIFSEMDIKIDYSLISAPDEWALYISQALGATTYINPPGGYSFFDKNKYLTNGINLIFLDTKLEPYNQHRPIFESGLSIIDVLLFNSPEQVRAMLNDVVEK